MLQHDQIDMTSGSKLAGSLLYLHNTVNKDLGKRMLSLEGYKEYQKRFLVNPPIHSSYPFDSLIFLISIILCIILYYIL